MFTVTAVLEPKVTCWCSEEGDRCVTSCMCCLLTYFFSDPVSQDSPSLGLVGTLTDRKPAHFLTAAVAIFRESDPQDLFLLFSFTPFWALEREA